MGTDNTSGAVGLAFGVLGSLQVLRDNQPIVLGGMRQRAVLARLLVAPDRVVSFSALVEAVWRESAPRGLVPCSRCPLVQAVENRQDPFMFVGELARQRPTDAEIGDLIPRYTRRVVRRVAQRLLRAGDRGRRDRTTGDSTTQGRAVLVADSG